MKKLALPDELLLQVQKPARYLGNEMNAVHKDRRIPIRFAMCFPDLYEIGMSHLGIQILYELFNRREDTWCERVFSPWTDMDRLLRDRNIPLFALESQDPVRDFDFLGMTLQFELCYTNILQVLDLSGIPLEAADRTDRDPIVIGGGPCACNPEPVARFFDMFYIGEGETSYDALLDLYRSMKEKGAGRAAFLRAAAQVPGIYVPSLYEVEYGEDGTIASFRPKYPDVPAVVRRQAERDLDRAPYPLKPLIPFITVTQDRVAVELQRGCIRGCRFCQAGMIYRPNRERDLETVRAYADAMLESTGQDDILLSSLSSSDYSCIHEIVDHISDRYEKERVKLQVPSLRIDAFSLDLMARVQDVRRSSLTFAPEAGSQRLRDVINKGITEEDILKGAREAFRGGWNKVKLYFMLGLPTETEEDRTAISDLANKISAAYYEEVPKAQRNGRCQITVSTSFFVPKPFTPFQWAPMYHAGDYLGFAAQVNHAIYASHNHRSIRYSWHDAPMIYLEGVLARGDRRTADLILEAYRRGAVFDCWLETWDYDRWDQAAADLGFDMDFYTLRERGEDEIFPWDFIDVGVRREFLRREWDRAKEAQLTSNCREACSGCGAASYGCGVCLRGPEHSDEPVETREPGPGTEAEAGPSDMETEAEKTGICIKIRMRLAKYGPMKFIGHLELMRFLQKCIRRTDIDIRYSDGITPRMIMSTAMPLGLGLTSTGEYVDMEIGTPVSTAHALDQLRPMMPEGLEILDFRQIGETVPLGGGGNARKPQKAMSVVAAAVYEVGFRGTGGYIPPENWRQVLEDFVAQDQILWTKETKKGFRTLDMKPLIYEFACEGDRIRMCVCSRVGENLRPEQIIGEAFRRSGLDLPEDALEIHRADLLAEREPDGREGAAAEGAAEPSARFISLGEMGRIIEE
ncbi:MAG: TIGR03960 family B12-binding radical SAM protein [Lachnospiraceae bacterium]|nr:TIGR03960 family B12-binding radical SAM protein [Lachnospiraceae bacterium]